MDVKYTINEIISAVDELQHIRKKDKLDAVTLKKTVSNKKDDIPFDTLKLIEDAEKTIKSKLQPE